RVVVPGIPALFARPAKRNFLVLQLLGLRIGVRRREFDLVGTRTEKRARRLAQARRNAFGFSRCEIECVDLVERIPGFTLALKHETFAVGPPVPLAPPLAF